MNLNLLIIVPLITALLCLPFRDRRQVRMIALAGAVVQLLLTALLIWLFVQVRAGGNTSVFLFETNMPWYLGPLGDWRLTCPTSTGPAPRSISC